MCAAIAVKKIEEYFKQDYPKDFKKAVKGKLSQKTTEQTVTNKVTTTQQTVKLPEKNKAQLMTLEWMDLRSEVTKRIEKANNKLTSEQKKYLRDMFQSILYSIGKGRTKVDPSTFEQLTQIVEHWEGKGPQKATFSKVRKEFKTEIKELKKITRNKTQNTRRIKLKPLLINGKEVRFGDDLVTIGSDGKIRVRTKLIVWGSNKIVLTKKKHLQMGNSVIHLLKEGKKYRLKYEENKLIFEKLGELMVDNSKLKIGERELRLTKGKKLVFEEYKLRGENDIGIKENKLISGNREIKAGDKNLTINDDYPLKIGGQIIMLA